MKRKRGGRGPDKNPRSRSRRGWRIDKLMAAGMPRDEALEVARRQAFSDYQKRRYATDPEFRERQKENSK